MMNAATISKPTINTKQTFEISIRLPRQIDLSGDFFTANNIEPTQRRKDVQHFNVAIFAFERLQVERFRV